MSMYKTIDRGHFFHPEATTDKDGGDKDKKGVHTDEDFIRYLQGFARIIHLKLNQTEDEDQTRYYRGMLFALESVCEVYEALIRKEFI